MKTHQDLPPHLKSPGSGLADWEYTLLYGQDNQPPTKTEILQSEIRSLAVEPTDVTKDTRRKKYQERNRRFQDHGTASTERGNIARRQEKEYAGMYRPSLISSEVIDEGLVEAGEVDDYGPLWLAEESYHDHRELVVPSGAALDETVAELSARDLSTQRGVYHFTQEVYLDPKTAEELLHDLEGGRITKGQVLGVLAARAASRQDKHFMS